MIFVAQPNGGLIVVLEKREPLNTAQFEAARPIVEKREMANKNQIVFYEWLQERRHSAGVKETRPQQATTG